MLLKMKDDSESKSETSKPNAEKCLKKTIFQHNSHINIFITVVNINDIVGKINSSRNSRFFVRITDVIPAYISSNNFWKFITSILANCILTMSALHQYMTASIETFSFHHLGIFMHSKLICH